MLKRASSGLTDEAFFILRFFSVGNFFLTNSEQFYFVICLLDREKSVCVIEVIWTTEKW